MCGGSHVLGYPGWVSWCGWVSPCDALDRGAWSAAPSLGARPHGHAGIALGPKAAGRGAYPRLASAALQRRPGLTAVRRVGIIRDCGGGRAYMATKPSPDQPKP